MFVLSSRLLLRGLLLAAVLLASSGAAAHVNLVGSTPAADAHVPALPRIELVFDGALQPGSARVTLSRLGAGGEAMPVGGLAITMDRARTRVWATPEQSPAQGHYRVEWHVIGTDGHPRSGSFGFMMH